MNFSENNQCKRKYIKLFSLISLFITAIYLSGCSNNEPSKHSPSSGNPSASGAVGNSAAMEWLNKSQAAAGKMTKYGFELQLKQKISGGNEKTDQSDVEIDMQGRAEQNPLMLDQTIKSNIDGEVSTLRSIVVPDAYYMYLPEYEEWNKLGKDIAAENMATLSDFQVNPGRALQGIQGLGQNMNAEQSGQIVSLRYEGVSPEAVPFLSGILDSTMGFSSMESSIRSSLEIQKLNVVVNIDAEKHWPLSYRIESDMTIELEAGYKSTVTQTLAGTYSKHNVSAAVTVPKEALNAIDPDKMDEELNLK